MTIKEYKNKVIKLTGKILKKEEEGILIMFNKDIPIDVASKITIKMRK